MEKIRKVLLLKFSNDDKPDTKYFPSNSNQMGLVIYIRINCLLTN